MTQCPTFEMPSVEVEHSVSAMVRNLLIWESRRKEILKHAPVGATICLWKDLKRAGGELDYEDVLTGTVGMKIQPNKVVK
jgi:hypothetical protein